MTLPSNNMTFLATRKDGVHVKKGFFWTPDRDGAKEWLTEPDPKEQGRWLGDKTFGENNLKCHKWRIDAFRTDTLLDRYKLREMLSLDKMPATGLLQGVAHERLQFQLDTEDDQFEHWYCNTVVNRDGKSLVDAPRHPFIMDIDGIDGRLIMEDFNAIEHQELVPDLLDELLDMIGLDFLIADRVLQFSSSYGTDPHKINLHYEVMLREPLTLAKQKILAQNINNTAIEKLSLTGKDKFIDPDVYDNARIFFVAPPVMRRVQYGHGSTPAASRMRLMHRVQYQPIGIPFVNIDDGFIQGGDNSSYGPLRRSSEHVDTVMRPRHTHIPVRTATAKMAMGTRAEYMALELLKVQSKLRQEILFPDEEHKMRERYARTSIQNLAAQYLRGILNKRFERCGEVVPETRVFKTQQTIEDVRDRLRADMTDIIKEGLDQAPATFGSRHTYTLFKVPAGVGKSHAALAALKEETLHKNRLSYLTPIKDLGAELEGRSLKYISDRSLVRHVKGRLELCKMKNEVQGKMCTTLEEAGMSVVTAVCSKCPKNDICKYPAQQSYKGPGLIIGQHAHVAGMRRLKADSDGAQVFQFIDESILDTVLQEPKRRSLHKLRKNTNSIKMRGDGATSDLIAYRDEVLTLIENKATDILKTAHLNSLRRTTFNPSGKGRTVYATALAMEKEFARSLRGRIGDEVKAFHEEYVKKGRGKHKRHVRAAQKLQGELATTEWFIDLWTAIEASLDIAGREYVFGLRISRGGMVSIGIRHPLPEIFGEIDGIALDATADEELFKTIMRKSNVNVRVREYEVLPGPYKLYQYTDRPYSLTMLSKSTEANSNIAKMLKFIRLKSVQHKGSVLVVAQKSVSETLEKMAPDIAAYRYFKKLRGLDQFKNHACIIVIGRHMPPKEELELMAEAIHYDDPDTPALIPQPEKFHTVTSHLRRHGHADCYQIQAESHPDPRVAAIMRQQGEMEVRQAVARLRLYDRTESTEAEIHVFGQCDTLLDVSVVMDWKQAEIQDEDFVWEAGVAFATSKLDTKSLREMLPDASQGTRGVANKKACSWIRLAQESSAYGAVGALKRNSNSSLTISKLYELLLDRIRNYSEWVVNLSDRPKKVTVWVDQKMHGDDPEVIRGLIESETGIACTDAAQVGCSLSLRGT